MSLAGRNVIVTGAASGIGLATALRFAREGANVAVWDRLRRYTDVAWRGGVAGLGVAVEAVASRSPMGRPGRPENMAAAIVFLATDDADYITGHTLSVNGGRYSS